MAFVRWLLASMAAIVVTTILGSIIQTQFNLARLAQLGAEVSVAERLQTTLFDLGSFAPLWGLVITLALLPAFGVAVALKRLIPRIPGPPWSLLCGYGGVLVALIAMQVLLPVTPVAAARSHWGFLLLAFTGAIGGLVHARLFWREQGDQESQRQNGQN
ncbi:hypothetical protein IC757_07400 [Wenzhouxiangella sp. AB-CW3]|uniref:hypothetical protein n=1 Tax=Wenzhouxiangella sp. AB-CW3 TaxID=2771012 RepID=UPI00168B8807|nr:hypothetical protein [Wenzhouxiangella sp. AB-CW3]QOC23927.1 hypothetical protein IC757_07400 [Wenzhouxiangella sp. AB-CW3]